VKDTRKYSVYPSDLNILESFQRLQEMLKRMQFVEDLKANCDQVRFSVTLPGDRRLLAVTFAEFLDILHNSPAPLTTWTHSHWKKKDIGIAIDIDISVSGIDVGVSGDLAVILGMHDAIRDVFHASSPEPQRSPSLSRYNLKKSVFLAHRFDDQGNSAARAVSTFLARLGFQVLEGEGYESKDIPTKVADRIRTQDIFTLLGTPGDASWILSEAGFAKALNKYLVVLVQEDAVIKKSIIGADHEHISFPKSVVEKAFNYLLYALPR